MPQLLKLKKVLTCFRRLSLPAVQPAQLVMSIRVGRLIRKQRFELIAGRVGFTGRCQSDGSFQPRFGELRLNLQSFVEMRQCIRGAAGVELQQSEIVMRPLGSLWQLTIENDGRLISLFRLIELVQSFVRLAQLVVTTN